MIANHLSDTYVSGRLLLPASKLPPNVMLASIPAAGEPDKVEVQAGLMSWEFTTQYFLQPTAPNVTLGSYANPFYGINTTAVVTQAPGTISQPSHIAVFLNDPTAGAAAEVIAIPWSNFVQMVAVHGEKGDKGDPGEKWWTGTSDPPPAGTGINGDWYLNSSNGDYWEKQAGSWVKIGNLKGTKGDKGDKGDPGEKWWTGTSDPPPGGTGVTGDWYLNSSNGDYWEKQAGGWVKIGNLKGLAGSDGAPGEKWFTGALGGNVPPSGIGVMSDWFLDSSTGNYFEKTSGSFWTYSGNLKGPPGDKGDTGEKGDKGVPGEQWHTSLGAPAGSLGAPGDFCLDVSTGDVYEKTGTSAWTFRVNIKGPKGDTGTPGIGTKGDKGDPGERWFTSTGNPTDINTPGSLQGDWYLDSSTGNYWEKTASTQASWVQRGNLKGLKGDNGNPGAAGEKWHLGVATPPPAGTGITGDLYLHTPTGDYWEKQSGGWVLIGNLKGPKGDKGDAATVIGPALLAWITIQIDSVSGAVLSILSSGGSPLPTLTATFTAHKFVLRVNESYSDYTLRISCRPSFNTPPTPSFPVCERKANVNPNHVYDIWACNVLGSTLSTPVPIHSLTVEVIK